MPTDVRTPCQTNWRPFIAPEGERTAGPSAQARVAEAKQLCHGCFRRIACRDEGRAIGAEGIWGGEDDRERRKAGSKLVVIRASAIPADCGTEAGAKRHRRNDETVCGPCLAGESQANRLRKAARRAARPKTMPQRAPQILAMLADGMAPREIGYALGLQKATIYGHMQRTALVLGIDGTERLVPAARAAGILPPIPAAVDLGPDALAAAA